MTRPVKRMAASLRVACLILNGAALAVSTAFALNPPESGADTPNPNLNPPKPKIQAGPQTCSDVWNVTVHSLGPNELGQAIIGPTNCPGKPITLHANIAPPPGRKIQ